MEAVIEKECSALGGLFQTLIGDMKVSGTTNSETELVPKQPHDDVVTFVLVQTVVSNRLTSLRVAQLNLNGIVF